jgi:Zn finger protein HypA/HybF involved in hydrogenase expression
MAVFFPAAESLVTTRISRVGEHAFKTEGRVLVNPGWQAIYGREGGDDTLPPVAAGEPVAVDDIALLALSTRPPPRYNEATLLSAMEGAGKLIDDDDLRAAMADKGLGTPATRASIIEGLIAENYLIRDGKELIPTTKAFQLLTLLRGLGVAELTAPELTGEWEHKLAEMERGRLGREAFMREIADMTRQIVERAKNYQADTVPGNYATLSAPCPRCGAVVQENYRRYACTACDFSISKIPGARQLEVAEAEALINDGTIGPLQGFRSKMGRPFAAILKLTPDHRLEFDFGQSDRDDDALAEAIDFSDRSALGACPKCGGSVYEHGMSYICERTVGPARSCDFRSGKIILQQEIGEAQMRKLLAEGRTDLLDGFISARTRRKFKAFLVRNRVGASASNSPRARPNPVATRRPRRFRLAQAADARAAAPQRTPQTPTGTLLRQQRPAQPKPPPKPHPRPLPSVLPGRHQRPRPRPAAPAPARARQSRPPLAQPAPNRALAPPISGGAPSCATHAPLLRRFFHLPQRLALCWPVCRLCVLKTFAPTGCLPTGPSSGTRGLTIVVRSSHGSMAITALFASAPLATAARPIVRAWYWDWTAAVHASVSLIGSRRTRARHRSRRCSSEKSPTGQSAFTDRLSFRFAWPMARRSPHSPSLPSGKVAGIDACRMRRS